tara:strand:- start:3216 stop:3443 length:228 start_codon:yes stop_codon:yes gene_type:complete
MDPECFSKCPVTVPPRTVYDEADLCNPIITNIPKHCNNPLPNKKKVEKFEKPSNNSLSIALLLLISIVLTKKMLQ